MDTSSTADGVGDDDLRYLRGAVGAPGNEARLVRDRLSVLEEEGGSAGGDDLVPSPPFVEESRSRGSPGEGVFRSSIDRGGDLRVDRRARGCVCVCGQTKAYDGFRCLQSPI